MSRTRNLLEAEYNGQKFSWLSETESGGRNLVLYKKPNSNAQTIQDLGGIPQTFTIKAVVSGVNYLADSERFRNALVQGGVGDLIAPNFGIHKVRLQEYTRDTSQAGIGRHEYILTFVLETMTGLEGVSFVTVEDIYNGYNEANDALAESVARNWEEPRTNANRLSAISDTKTFLESAQEAIKDINTAVRQAERLKNQVETAISVAELYADLLVNEGVFAFLSSAVGLGSSYVKIRSMIDFGKNLPTRLQELASSVSGAFSAQVSDDKDFVIPLWKTLYTPEWDERNNNRIVTVETNRAGALLAMMNDVSNIDFQTAEQVQGVMLELQTFAQALVTNSNSIIFNDPDFMEKLLQMKEICFSYLNQVRDEVFYKVDISVNNIPPNVVSALLYGETSRDEIIRRSDILRRLNDGQQIFDGKITVLERKE